MTVHSRWAFLRVTVKKKKKLFEKETQLMQSRRWLELYTLTHNPTFHEISARHSKISMRIWSGTPGNGSWLHNLLTITIWGNICMSFRFFPCKMREQSNSNTYSDFQTHEHICNYKLTGLSAISTYSISQRPVFWSTTVYSYSELDYWQQQDTETLTCLLRFN